MILKRTKTETGLPPDKKPTTLTHFAAKIEASGIVASWVNDPAQACPIDEATAAKVKAAYANRPNAGKFELTSGDGITAAVKAESPSAAALKAENARLVAALKDGAEKHAAVLKEKSDLAAERDLLREENERLKKAASSPPPAK